jgi:hypothetical protein
MSSHSESPARALVGTLRKHDPEACFYQVDSQVPHFSGLIVLIREQYPANAQSKLSSELYQLR